MHTPVGIVVLYRTHARVVWFYHMEFTLISELWNNNRAYFVITLLNLSFLQNFLKIFVKKKKKKKKKKKT